jgi:hypothetical protein
MVRAGIVLITLRSFAAPERQIIREQLTAIKLAIAREGTLTKEVTETRENELLAFSVLSVASVVKSLLPSTVTHPERGS